MTVAERDITKLEHLNAKGIVAWLYEVRPELDGNRTVILGPSLARRLWEWENSHQKQATLDSVDRICVTLDLHICEIPEHLWEEREGYERSGNRKCRSDVQRRWAKRRGLELLREGHFPSEVARLVDVTPATVRNWRREMEA